MILKNRIHPVLIAICFFSSGFSALLYQIVWLKYLSLLFGNTTYATAAVLAAFFSGLSLGSWLVPRVASLFRSPIRSYGLMELGVGLYALFFRALYIDLKYPSAFLFHLFGPQSGLYNVFTFGVAFFALLLPTAFMGATLPLLSFYLIRDEQVGSKIGMLYGINTVGAFTGILTAAFILIPKLGLQMTVLVGVVINLLVGLACFLGGKQEHGFDAVPWKDKSPASSPILYLYGVSGAVAIAYEVLWTRILVLHFGSSVYSYAIMLSVFLLGISVGSYICGKWIGPHKNRTLFAWLQIAWAFSILLQLLQFSRLSDTLSFVTGFFHTFTSMAQFSTFFISALQLLFWPTFLSGALFPFVVNELFVAGDSIQVASSKAYSYNTIGGISGSLLAGFLLIPLFGTQNGLLVLATINLFLGLIWGFRSQSSRLVLISFGILFIGGAILCHHRIQILRSAGIFQMEKDEALINLEEDISATISVEKKTYNRVPYYSLSVNGVNVAGTSPPLVTIQKLQAHLPLILYGASKPKSVLHIGFGSGGTAYSVSLYPQTKITVVELTRGVVRNAARYFQSVNHGVVNSGKLNFIFFDGRTFLQNTNDHFDVILSDSIHPRYAGNGSLYTKDYYQLVFDHLNPGGVHSQWIPIYSLSQKNLQEILRAFIDVFPTTYVWYINSTVNPYVIVTGKKANPNSISIEEFHKALEIPAVGDDLKKIAAGNVDLLLDYFLFGPKEMSQYVANSDPHTDDRMTVEYESSRILDRQLSWWLNFRDLINYRESISSYLSDPDHFDPPRYGKFYDATKENLQGQLFVVSGETNKGAEYFARAHRMNSEDPDPMDVFVAGHN
jgi:spermidine synthase